MTKDLKRNKQCSLFPDDMTASNSGTNEVLASFLKLMHYRYHTFNS